MYIVNVLSHLGAWNMLQEQYSQEYSDINRVIENLQVEKDKSKFGVYSLLYSPRKIHQALKDSFRNTGWQVDNEINLLIIGRERKSIIDAIKGRVGIEYTLAKFSYAESAIFVKFPLFLKADKFDIAVLLLPNKSLTKSMTPGIGSFELVRDRLLALSPLPQKYPFALIGISDGSDNIVIEELTSELDQYLINNIGFSLLDMQLKKERTNYDFKVQLPENSRVAKEICAFANCEQGGIVLLGVNDNGIPVGINREEIDAIQLRIQQVTKDSCIPAPELDIQIFDAEDQSRCIILIRIREVLRKPCMFQDRVYIRTGTSAHPANSEQIRKLLLGLGA
jgi:hypothetical protein